MRTIILVCALLVGCSSQLESSTPNCDKIVGTGWGQGYGIEVESSSNLDSQRCAQFDTVFCCAL